MTDLKEIKGKMYMKCDIHVTKTTKKSNLGFLTEAGLKRGDLRYYETLMPIILDSVNIFLHVTYPTKKIEKGDFIFYNGDITRVLHMDDMFITLDNNQMVNKLRPLNKLVATTQPVSFFNNVVSKAFLNVYAKQFQKGAIRNAYVEVIGPDLDIKVNTNNEISIKKYEEPVYSKAEVEAKIKEALKLAGITNLIQVKNILNKTL